MERLTFQLVGNYWGLLSREIFDFFFIVAKLIILKITDTWWRLHFARLSKGAWIDQKLTPAHFVFLISSSIDKLGLFCEFLTAVSCSLPWFVRD